MRTHHLVVVAGVAAVLSAAAAAATTTYSPPVRSDMDDNLGCRLLNLSAAELSVESTLEDGLGNVVDAQTFAIPAGQARLMARSNAAIFGGFCRFTFEGDPSQVRGFITLEDAGGSNTRLLYPAGPIAGDPPLGITTYSPPVRSSEGDNLGCPLLNLGDAPVQVTSRLHDGLGGVVDTQDFAVPAGQGRLMARSSDAIFGGYCSFTFEGDPTAVRGYITLQDAGGSNTRLLYPASPALAAAAPTPTIGDITPTATVVPTAPAGCCGDCDASGDVAINELIIAVNNALDGCP
jgi:hypothetical protein